MGRLESPLEAWCVKWARAHEIIVAKLTQVDGIPDRVFFLPGGRPLVVEFKGRKKRGKGLQEKTQPWYIAKLRQDGYEVHCCDTRGQFMSCVGTARRAPKNLLDFAPGSHVYRYGKRYVVCSVNYVTGTVVVVELNESTRETITPQTAHLWEVGQ